MSCSFLLCLALCLDPASAAAAPLQVGSSLRSQKISGLGGRIEEDDYFGSSLAALGDVDGDGNRDLAVGAIEASAEGTRHGSIWILFLERDGSVRAQTRIAHGVGGFRNGVTPPPFLGTSLTALGDLDHDGIPDLAAGLPRADDGATDGGAVWILFLNRDGTVKDQQRISAVAGNFDGVIRRGSFFGNSLSGLGDVDGDGFVDLAVGAPGDRSGVVWIVRLQRSEERRVGSEGRA